ncbi:MAG: hypothetical protein LBE02_07435 [Spirochaetaceae bacterium]|jgi:hypothetical protein|nr:hypothetical protein [Spirochaetaceae bacterium]
MEPEKYLETLPLNKIEKTSGIPPKNAVPFTGYPRSLPSEKNKLLLVYDPLGLNPVLMEFQVEDILYVEEIPQAVTESGEGIPLVKIWVRRGARGVLLEPFEVDDPIQFINKTRDAYGRLQLESGAAE